MSYRIIAVICFLFGASVVSAAPPAKDVNVANTPDVNVISMPPVDAQVTGTIDTNVVNTPDVNVVGTPGVTVENSELTPVPVKVIGDSNSNFENVRLRFNFELTGASMWGSSNRYTVPEGKRLFIKYLSCQGFQLHNLEEITDVFFMSIFTVGAEDARPIFFNPERLEGTRRFIVSQPVPITVEENISIYVYYARKFLVSNGGGQTAVDCNLHGHLRDM